MLLNAFKIAEMVRRTKGKIFSATFIKKDGTIRRMTCKTRVAKDLKGGVNYAQAPKFPYITVYDMHKRGYRMLNPATMLSMRINGVDYEIIGNDVTDNI